MTKYTEKDIERYAGLDGIRKKPTVYVGPVDNNGLWTIIREPADNCVDQALAGRNKLVHLILDSVPNKYWILDNGEGIPIGKKEFIDERGRKEKLSTLYVVTGLTHGGGNFTGANISRGTHGLGIKTSNALSTSFKVWTKRENQWYYIEYSKGKLIKDVCKVSSPKLPHGIKVSKGTVIMVEPDLSIFTKNAKVLLSDIQNWCTLTSYLVPNLTVKFTDSKGKTTVQVSKNGPVDFLKKKIEELKCTTYGRDFVLSTRNIDVATAFTDAEGSNLINCYTNGLLNIDGGEHLRAFYDALHKSLTPYKGRCKFTLNDLKEGIIGLVNYKISAPSFNNQHKDKLIDSRVYKDAYSEIFQAVEEFWKKNKALAKRICQRADELKSLKDEFSQNKKVLKVLATAKKKNDLPDKFSAASKDCPANKREAYTVEGDSAGGCFTIETAVQLWDGTTKTFAQLIEDFEKGIDNIGVSYDATNKKFVPFKIHHPRQTLNVTELIELTTDSGHVIRCTIDHPFMLEDGSYKRADQLTEDDIIREFQPFVTDVV